MNQHVREIGSNPLRVLFIARKNVTSGSTPAIVARSLANAEAALAELACMADVELHVADMEEFTLPEQVSVPVDISLYLIASRQT